MMMSPHLLPDQTGIVTYIIAGVISIPQVLNVAIAYTILYLS
jgi:hypothetical protein